MGNWAERYAGVTAIVATLLAAASASASGRLSQGARRELGLDGAVSYPTTYAVPLDNKAAQVLEVDAALMKSPIAQLPEDRQVTSPRELRDVKQFLSGRREWSRVQLPEMVRRKPRDAEVYLVKGEGRICLLVARRGTRLYHLPGEFNQLLWDSGMKFRSADVRVWAPMIVYLATASERFAITSRGLGDSGGSERDSIMAGMAPLVPMLEVDAMTTELSTRWDSGEPWLLGAGYVMRVSVSYTVAGQRQTVEIQTQGGDDTGHRAFPWGLRGTLLNQSSLELPGEFR